MSKLVHFHVFDPKQPSLFKAKANDHAEAHIVRCSLEGTCPVRAKGQCIERDFWSSGCPYGSRSVVTGPTKRSRDMSKWIAAQREGVGPNPPTLSSTQKVMAVIGDYVWLPYPHMDFHAKSPTLEISLSSGRKMLRIEEFTPEVVQRICEWRPRAMFGGEITDYQKESVPLFVKHLSEVMPDLFAATAAVYPNLRELLAKTTNIGREARLRSLAPNVGEFVDIHGGRWTWDGEYLTSKNSKMSFGLVNGFSEIRVKPDPASKVKVTSEGQVTPTTEFLS